MHWKHDGLCVVLLRTQSGLWRQYYVQTHSEVGRPLMSASRKLCHEGVGPVIPQRDTPVRKMGRSSRVSLQTAMSWRSKPSWSGMVRWFWGYAGVCLATLTTPTMRSRRRFSCWFARPGSFVMPNAWGRGCTAWRRAWRPRREPGSEAAGASESRAGRHPRPDDPDGDWFEVRPILDAELGKLSPKLRDILVLCLLEGLTAEEASHQLACPVGTVKSRLARGREALRGGLMARGLAPAAALAVSRADRDRRLRLPCLGLFP